MTDTKKPLTIIRFEAENIKRLKAVQITPRTSLIQVTGANESGKTSVLDAIWWALAGTKNIDSKPIRVGADKGFVRLDLGEFIVERTFKGNKTQLYVTSREGAEYKSPQTLLDGWLSGLCFDPNQFSRMSAKDQLEAVRKVVPLAVDVDMLDALNRKDFEERTTVNRQVRETEAMLAGIIVDDSLPTDVVDESALLSEMENSSATNGAIDREGRRRDSLRGEVAMNLSAANDIRSQVAEALARAETLEKSASEKQALIDSLPMLDPYVDVSEVRQKIDEAKRVNQNADKVASRERVRETLKALKDESERLTSLMDHRNDQKVAAISVATFPVEGLSFGDGELIYNGNPFSQASGAVKLRVGMSMAAAANPHLRVIRMTEGSLLDENAIREVEEWAEERGFQVWLERVDTSGKIGIVMDDGTAHDTADA